MNPILPPEFTLPRRAALHSPQPRDGRATTVEHGTVPGAEPRT